MFLPSFFGTKREEKMDLFTAAHTAPPVVWFPKTIQYKIPVSYAVPSQERKNIRDEYSRDTIYRNFSELLRVLELAPFTADNGEPLRLDLKVPVRDYVRWMSLGYVVEYVNNRPATGQYAESTMCAVRDHFSLSAFGSPSGFYDFENHRIQLVDGHSRSIGLWERINLCKMREHEYEQVFNFTIVKSKSFDVASAYIDLNAGKPHDKKDYIKNEDTPIGAIKNKLAKPLPGFQFPDEKMWYTVLDLCFAVNDGAFTRDGNKEQAVGFNLRAIRRARAHWHELYNKSSDEFNYNVTRKTFSEVISFLREYESIIEEIKRQGAIINSNGKVKMTRKGNPSLSRCASFVFNSSGIITILGVDYFGLQELQDVSAERIAELCMFDLNIKTGQNGFALFEKNVAAVGQRPNEIQLQNAYHAVIAYLKRQRKISKAKPAYTLQQSVEEEE